VDPTTQGQLGAASAGRLVYNLKRSEIGKEKHSLGIGKSKNWGRDRIIIKNYLKLYKKS